jgi:hypothetical protein
MGGGRRKIKEVRKSSNLSARHSSQTGGPAGAEADLSVSLCERKQQLTIRMSAGARLSQGDSISAVRASPPAILVSGLPIGEISDPQQAQTIAACLDAGYSITGEVTMVNAALGTALALVAGVRSGK